MTTFSEIYQATVEQTKRPELVAMTEAAIRIATLRAHHVDFFPRDLRMQQLVYAVNPTQMYYDFPNISTTLLPRLRSIKNVYTLTADGQHQIEELEYRETNDLYDSDGAPRRYMYTLIGDTLRCFFDMPTGLMEAYFFANPIVSKASYASWIADEYIDDLAAWAAGIVMARTGFLELAQNYERDYVRPFKETLISSHLLAAVN